MSKIAEVQAQTSNKPCRIGEIAHTVGVTTRTLRYWQEINLLVPHGKRAGTERLYREEDITRAQHIRELQALFGFTLAEIGVILKAEDALADIKSAYDPAASPEKRRMLSEAALLVTIELLSQIDIKVDRIKDYRAQLAAKIEHLQTKLATIDRK